MKLSAITTSKYYVLVVIFLTYNTTNTSCKSVQIHSNDSQSQKANSIVSKQLVSIQKFIDNKDYFIVDIDFNNDNILDKIVSSKKYLGNELYFFQQQESDKYVYVAESINFSEDGGNIIGSIYKESNYIVINTFFPDGGNYQANYYVKYENSILFLDYVKYITNYWQDDYTKTYSCIVHQKLNMNKFIVDNYTDNIKQIPERSKREEVCEKQYYVDNLDEFLLRFTENEYDDYRTVRGIERYKDLIEKIPLNSTNKFLYREIIKNLEVLKFKKEFDFIKTKLE